MKILMKTWVYLPLLMLLIAGLFIACEENNPITVPSLPDNSSGINAGAPSDNETQDSSNNAISQDEPIKQPDKVDVVYFHSTQRCKTCLYIEQRIVYVTETYFQDELDSGKITLRRLDLGDKENADLISKYGAVSSQLYINMVVDGVDHIKNIKEVWFRDYLRDEKLFDEMVRSYIEQGLNGEL